LWKINPMIVTDTTVKGKYMLRVCNVNNKTQREDFDFLINEIKKIGEKVTQTI